MLLRNIWHTSLTTVCSDWANTSVYSNNINERCEPFVRNLALHKVTTYICLIASVLHFCGSNENDCIMIILPYSIIQWSLSLNQTALWLVKNLSISRHKIHSITFTGDNQIDTCYTFCYMTCKDHQGDIIMPWSWWQMTNFLGNWPVLSKIIKGCHVFYHFFNVIR